MPKKGSKKRSDFVTAKEYKRWLTRSKASKNAWKVRRANELRKKIVETHKASIRGLKEPKFSRGHGVTEEQIKRLGISKAKLKQLERVRNIAYNNAIKRQLKAVPVPPNLSIKELEERLAKSEYERWDAARLLEGEILTRGFVHSEDAEWLRRDNFAIAMQPSRLRHMGTVTDEILKILEAAEKKGVRALRKKAKEFAMFFDVPVREVYTLHFSP